MAKAEVGTPKYIANQMKAKGLQRLRWYCQVCEKQCRDENGFKCHTQSESHVRQMLLVGEHAGKSIAQFSKQFRSDFLFLLRTGHGEKSVNANRFYQEYIGNKDHVHMNATHWASLTEFVKQLGREGVCRVEETEENGLCLAWIDSSPEALKRQEAIRKKERADRGDEARTIKALEKQIEQAKQSVKPVESASTVLDRSAAAPLKLSLGNTSTSSPVAVAAKPVKKNVFASGSKVSKPTKPATAQKPLNAFARMAIKEQNRKKPVS